MAGMTASTHTLDVPDAQLYYEVRGSGPLLLILGAPMAAADFAALADVLARDHTVVTQDPRGISASRLADPEQDSTPDLRADDAAAILAALGAASADVLGSSGGAVTGLALVARHPGLVTTLVAHEPPLLELLPDAERRRAEVEDMIDTFHREGQGAAWMKFMISAGFFRPGQEPPGPPPAQGEPSAEAISNGNRFFAHELRATTRYRPDVPALTSGRTRVVVGLGVDSGHLSTQLTSTALAELLGTAPVLFPGDHGGFIGRPEEFAEALGKVLAG
jgi:pimeloyl-ACP methyl ester carboxylesterase